MLIKSALEEMIINNSSKSPFKSSFLFSASGTNQGTIDNQIEQAMDMVKTHLMNYVQSEVEELREKIIKLEQTMSQQQAELIKTHSDFNREVMKLQTENEFLRNHVGPEVINKLPNLQFYNSVNQPPQN
jgi:hypothetical protein